MFMLKSTHREIVDTIRNGAAIVQASQHNEIVRLRAQLADSHARHAQTERNACDLASQLNRLTAERQVPAVRDNATGRFVKREG